MSGVSCPQCQVENAKGAKFCNQCGTQLPRACSQCGAFATGKARFCQDCGAPLDAAPAAAALDAPRLVRPRSSANWNDTRFLSSQMAAATATPITSFMERRQLTVVFTDLVSFTKLSQMLDPEDLNSVVHEYYGVCRAVCLRSNGFIANYLGDGVLIFFGYPHAREDDARRAVQTGLAILESVAGLNRRMKAERDLHLRVRVGIHTGVMVVGDDRSGNWKQMALGDTLNVAARIQSVTPIDAVGISAATHKLVDVFFDFRSLGIQELKGLAQPTEVFQVLAESTARSRLEAAPHGTLTPLTGRDHEVEALLKHWEACRNGVGHVVVLSGEAGIGKSRLVEVVKEEVARIPGNWLTPCHGSPYYQNTAFYPFIDLIQRVVLKFEREESPRDRLSKLEGMLVQYGFDLEEATPLFATLLSIPAEAGYTLPSISPAEQKRETVNALLRILIERSARQPLLLVLEDIHWIDPSTLELLNELSAKIDQHRIFALCTSRPEFSWPGAQQPNVTTLRLSRLKASEVANMARQVAAGKELPAPVIEHIASKTDGVPLFVEELVKMILESGFLRESEGRYVLDGPLPELAIPSTLQESLMARLDRLSTVKELAQIGAAIGREFSYELIRWVYPIDEGALLEDLHRLVDSELLFQTGEPPNATYTFKHALIQETAYTSLVKRRRQRYHRQIAQAIEEHFPSIVSAEPEVLAHHHAMAGHSQLAIPYLRKAGEKSSARSAHPEAIHHFTRALELLKSSPESPERTQLEIPLQIGLGVSLTATRGYGAAEVEQTYSRSLELSKQAGTPGQVFQSRYGLWRLHMLRAEYATARREADDLLAIATEQRNVSFEVAANRSLGATLFYMGEFTLSRKHVENVFVATAGMPGDTELFIRDIYDVVDPRVTCRSYDSWNLWMLGFPDQARAESARAIRLAEHLKHPFSQALALSFGAWLAQFCRDVPRVLELSTASIALARQHGFPFWVGWGQVLQGWAKAHMGENAAASLALIHNGLAYWREKGSELGRAYFLSLLADAHMQWGEWSSALDALAQAEKFADATGEHYWAAERLRIKGELMRCHLPVSNHEIEDCFRSAIETAKAQKARSIELRARTTLAGWLSKQGRKLEARTALVEFLGELSEGRDTHDYHQAEAVVSSAS